MTICHTAVTRLLECKDKDPYSTLGLNTTNASDADIKKAYKRHAFLVHPDKNQHPGAEEAFKILGSAYDQIGDEIKRQEYERQERQKKEDEAMEREVQEWLRQFEENVRRFKEQMELILPAEEVFRAGKKKELLDALQQFARTTMLCGSCKGRHKRILIERPLYSARYCQRCHKRHPAKENDLWAETSDLFTWMPTYKYFACMEGKIYDVTEWAVCNKYEAISYHANSHQVLFHIRTQPRPMDPPENEWYHPNRSRESRNNGNFSSSYGRTRKRRSRRSRRRRGR